MRERAELLNHIEELKRLREHYHQQGKPNFVRYIDQMIAEDEEQLAAQPSLGCQG